ncbi:MAG: HAD family hydrolase [Silvanigrellaceae bacterium]
MSPTANDVILSAECFLWDFDGCFADTERLHFLAYHEAFSHFGHQISEASYYPSFTHLGDGTRREIQSHGLNISEEEIGRLKFEAYARLIRQGPVSCFPETLELVRLMRARGARVAIASNSSEDEIRTVLGTAGFPLDELDLIVGKRSDLRKKPSPDIFLHALQVLNCQPGRSIVLEDSNRGLQAAAAAECAAIWMRTRYNDTLASGEQRIGEFSHAQLLELFRSMPAKK